MVELVSNENNNDEFVVVPSGKFFQRLNGRCVRQGDAELFCTYKNGVALMVVEEALSFVPLLFAKSCSEFLRFWCALIGILIIDSEFL